MAPRTPPAHLANLANGRVAPRSELTLLEGNPNHGDVEAVAGSLRTWAEADESNQRNYSFVTTASTLSERATDLRAAAAQLREQDTEIARLREALSGLRLYVDPDICRMIDEELGEPPS